MVTMKSGTPRVPPDISASSCSRNRSPSREFSSAKYSMLLPSSSMTTRAGSTAHSPLAASATDAGSGGAPRPSPCTARARAAAPSKSPLPYRAPNRPLAPASSARRIVAPTGSRRAVAKHRIIPRRLMPSVARDLSNAPASLGSALDRIAPAAPHSALLDGATSPSRNTAMVDLPDPYGPVTDIAWPRLPPLMPAPSLATTSSVPAPGM